MKTFHRTGKNMNFAKDKTGVEKSGEMKEHLKEKKNQNNHTLPPPKKRQQKPTAFLNGYGFL